MIRTVLGFFIAALTICIVIILAPFSSDDEPATIDVTRNETGNVTAPVAAPIGSTGTLAPGVAEAIAPAPGVAGQAAARILAASRAGQEPELKIQTDTSSIGDTTAGVLAALGLATGAAPAPTPAELGGDEMRNMTASVLSGIRGATGQPAAAAPQQNDLQTLVAWALKEGQSDSYIDALLNEAASAGQITVPNMLVTSDGRVDTATLLASIVQEATAATTGQRAAVPTTPLGPSDGVEVRVVQRAGETEQFRFYTVGSGDSLGSISVKFYGSVEYYPRIFEANRTILSSPDRIQTGQRLVIPELG